MKLDCKCDCTANMYSIQQTNAYKYILNKSITPCTQQKPTNNSTYASVTDLHKMHIFQKKKRKA